MSLNVNREVSDDFYRYKMPRLIAKVEGKGNGIKTVVVNMHEVGKALCRPPIYPTKYFGAELGAQTQFDQKNDRYIVNGAHDGERLQTILDGFIRKYVLCSKCENPETDLMVKSRGKQGELSAKCKACGSVANIGDNSRTTQFIIKNPPDETGLALAAAAGPGKSAGKGAGSGKKKRGGAGGADRSPEGGNSGDETAVTGAAEDHEQQQQLAGNDGEDEFDSDGDWECGDESALADSAAATAAVEELPASIQRLIVTEELLALTPQDRADRFHKFLSDRCASGNMKPIDLVLEAERLDIRDKAILVVAEVLLSSPATLATDITKTHRAVFLAFTNGSLRSQKYLMGAVESLIARFRDTLLNAKRILNLLHAFYSADLLSEEVLVEWDAKGPSKRHTGDRKLSKTIHEMAQPFINWLKTAAEESSSDDDEEDSDEAKDADRKPAAGTNGNGAGVIANGGANSGKSAPPQADDSEGADSDVDIDNI